MDPQHDDDGRSRGRSVHTFPGHDTRGALRVVVAFVWTSWTWLRMRKLVFGIVVRGLGSLDTDLVGDSRPLGSVVISCLVAMFEYSYLHVP